MANNGDDFVERRRYRLQQELAGVLLKQAKTNRNGTVPANLAMSLPVGPDDFTVEGGENLWMKKDSETEFYLMLEEASVQLTFIQQPNGVFRITRKAVGSTRRSHGKHIPITLHARDISGRFQY